MLYFEKNEWHIPEYKVIYTDGDDQLGNYVGIGGKQWWDDLAKQHDDINIVEYVELKHTEEELERLNTINRLGIPDGHGTVVSGYVLHGEFPDEPSHVLKDLETSLLKVENELLKSKANALTNELDFANDVIQEMIMTNMKGGE